MATLPLQEKPIKFPAVLRPHLNRHLGSEV